MKLKALIILFLFFGVCSKINAQGEFITTWQTNANEIYFPGTGTNYEIFWIEKGYESAHNGSMSNVTSTAGTPLLISFGAPLNPSGTGTYKIFITNGSGSFTQIQFYSSSNTVQGSHTSIVDVSQWGSDIHWQSMERAFATCSNLNVIATDVPDLSNVTNLSGMFSGQLTALVGNPSFNNWNTSHITNMSGMFAGCWNFNQPLTDWNTSNVINMSDMFSECPIFNQDIGSWNTSNVINMSGMFNVCQFFNQNIGGWDTSNVTDMSRMFMDSHFNNYIGDWNTSHVTNMSQMFYTNLYFNQYIGGWDTSHVTSMRQMFGAMFGGGSFNQNIGNWNTSNVTDMTGMFESQYGGQAFNQNIGGWDTSHVYYMYSMFLNATNFNQNLGNWNLTHANLSGMLSNSGLSCSNYDATLVGWANNAVTPHDISLGDVSPLIYSSPAAVAARSSLITHNGWTITGDTYNATCDVLATNEMLNEKFSVYPNPVKDNLNIQSKDNIKSVEITDVNGRIISTNNYNSTDVVLNIEKLESGVYFAIISSETGKSVQKIVKN